MTWDGCTILISFRNGVHQIVADAALIGTPHIDRDFQHQVSFRRLWGTRVLKLHSLALPQRLTPEVLVLLQMKMRRI